MEKGRNVTLMFVPDGSRRTRQLRLSVRSLRWLVALGVIGLALLCLMIGSWWYLVARARQAGILEDQMAVLLEREVQVEALARTLEQVEVGYEGIRTMLGVPETGPGGDLWLPPASPGRSGAPPGELGGNNSLPESWPLTERGFVTQILLETTDIAHPGIDIAVPGGSYVRASGSGRVIELGVDSIYGNYLVLDHGEGWRSLYAHASQLLVEDGDAVQRNEVIAVSGSSGRSTAPHLHFEILKDGEPVDPLTMVEQP